MHERNVRAVTGTTKRQLVVSVVLAVVILAAAGGVALLLLRLTRKPGHQEAPKPVVRVRAVTLRGRPNYAARIVGYGSARPKRRVAIKPKVTGEIVHKSPNLETGRRVQGPRSSVKPGELLLQIDPRPYELAAKRARQQVDLLKARIESLKQEQENLRRTEAIHAEHAELAKRHYERVRRVVLERKVGTENELEAAESTKLNSELQLQQTRNKLALMPRRIAEHEAELAAAETALDQAELDRSYADIRSPVTGRVLSVSVEAGERCQAGEVCAELYETKVMEVPVSIPAGDLRWIDQADLDGKAGDRSPGMADRSALSAEVFWQASGGQRVAKWRGRVERIEAGLEAQTRTARLIIAVDNQQQPNPPSVPLDLNMYCKVVVYGRAVPQAFLIPRAAILPDDCVYLIEGGRLAKRKVHVARFTDNEAMILPDQGLKDGDVVITSYVPQPVLGMRVEAVEPATRPTTASQPAGR